MPREPEGRGDPPDVRSFPPFLLDLRDERLLKDGKELALRRKPFAILRFLTANPKRLVTQEEIVDAVWGRIAMSESLLRTHVRELRVVLGEGLTETVVGRGYRFIPDVETVEKRDELARPEAHRSARSVVGRTNELDALGAIFQGTVARTRHVVFITGDAGIGKTTLVDAFLAQVAAPHGAVIAHGSCVEQFGTGEAYLPVLGALGGACRGVGGERIIDVLSKHAPTWLVQMPGIVSDDRARGLQIAVQGATHARMLRELAEAFDVLAADRPVLLVLEDVQWSDHSTINLLAMLGARREPASLLVIATCRRAALSRNSALANVMGELAAHRRATTLPLETLTEDALQEYFGLRFADHQLPHDLADTVHRMTGGNPLFTIAFIDDLESRRMIQAIDGTWRLAASVAEVADRRPDTVRQLIDIQMDRLRSDEQRVLEAASVAGASFSIGAVAHALDLPADEVDSICEALANERRFLRYVGADTWPDGTIQSHYAFTHALYRHAALARNPSATIRTWHRRVAERLEAAYGDAPEAIASELAVHFEESLVVAKAIHYYCAAGERATRRFGRSDALVQFERARNLVGRLAVSEQSDRTELAILKHVGPTLVALQPLQAPRLVETFTRTAELARKLRDERALLDALLGLQRCHFMKGELRAIERYESEIADVAAGLRDPVAAAEATVLSSAARLTRGQLDTVRQALTDACAVLDSAQASDARVVNAPVIGLSGGHMIVLSWLSGYPDKALAYARHAVARAETLRDPLLLATALTITALAHMWRREPERTLDVARRALQVAGDAGALVWQGRAMSLFYWASAMLDPARAGSHFEALSHGLSERLSAGPYGRTAFTPSIVEVCLRAGARQRALHELEEAIAFVERSDERAWSSELHRLHGELLRDSDADAADAAIEQALEIARAQGARSFELRAAMSRLRHATGRPHRGDALETVKQVYAWFTEGFDSADLVEARGLLAGACAANQP